MTRKEIAALVLGTSLLAAPMAMAGEAGAKCGGNKDAKAKTADAKCGAMKDKNTTAKCGAMKEKKVDAKCGTGKCGSKK